MADACLSSIQFLLSGYLVLSMHALANGCLLNLRGKGKER
jgi:hypothetical protein